MSPASDISKAGSRRGGGTFLASDQRSTSQSVSVITTLLPRSTWSTYTRSVLDECVAESQSQRKGGKGALAYASLLDFLHPAEARSLRLGSHRRVDGGVGARRRSYSTPGAHRGVGHGQGRRGRGRPAKNEIRRRGFFFFLGDQDALKYIRASVDQGKISIPRKAASQPSKHDEKVTTKVRSEIADSSQIRACTSLDYAAAGCGGGGWPLRSVLA